MRRHEVQILQVLARQRRYGEVHPRQVDALLRLEALASVARAEHLELRTARRVNGNAVICAAPAAIP
jgi:hypothetical protein